MRRFATFNNRKIVCHLLLATLCFSSVLSVRAPSSRAHQLDAPPQTSSYAYELLKISAIENRTNHLQALQTAQRALSIFKNLSDDMGIAEARMQIVLYHVALGELIEAEEVCQEALRYWRQQNNLQKQASALIYSSFIAQRRGDWPGTLALLIQAQGLINPQTDLVEMAQIANSFGFVYNQSGLPDIALGEYQRALDYFRQKDIPRGVNRMTMLIGYTHFLRGDYAAAATALNQALASFEHELDVAQCREQLARVEIGLGQYNNARQHLQAALTVYQNANNPMEVARVLALLGQIDEAEGAVARARTNYLDALRTFQQGDRFNEAAANFALGKLELKAGDYDRAETYLKQSVDTTEDLRRASVARDLTTAYSASVYERYQTYIECLLQKHKLQPSRGFDVLAFQTSELARARALAELLRDTQSSFAPGVNRSLAARERKLRQLINVKMSERVGLLAKKLRAGPEANTDDLQSQLDQLEASVTPLQHEYAEVRTSLREVNPLFDQVTEPTAYTLDQIQRDVIDDDQTVLLEFILGEQASYAWAVTRTGIKTYELPKQQLIADAAEKVYAEASEEPDDKRTQRLNEATERLTQLVLSPLAEELKAQRLIIVADGPLHYIPFQLLPAPNGTREPLIVNHEIVNAPSASILGRLRQENRQRGPSTKLLAAFGDPVFPANYAEFKSPGAGELVASVKANEIEPWRRIWRDVSRTPDNPTPESLQPLTYSKFELQRLKDLGGPTAFVARGFDASRESLGRLNLSQFSVLHFATHGLLDPEHPEFSGVVLSMVNTSGQPQDGFITIPDVYALKAPVDLVVLSACHTGLGKKVRGEGLIGLTSGFMHAGASSVAASLWKADDQATAKLMEYFYANMLEKNMRPADALRAAQNTMRTTPPWQSPHFWAAFTLQGEYRQPIRVPQPTGTPLKVQHAVGAALLLLLLAGIGWGYWRRRVPAN